MHAIQRYHYNRLQGFLIKLQQESETYQLPVHHLNTIVQQEKQLQQLYSNYLAALQQVSALIKQYEKEHQSVRRLMSCHKQYRKGLRKLEIENLKENIPLINHTATDLV